MKNNLLITALCLIIPVSVFGQDDDAIETNSRTSYSYDSAYTSGDLNARPFTNSEKRFDDWSISIGGGTALMHSADITSFYDGVDLGWNAYISLDKQITHAFGVSLMYAKGKTNQKAMVKPAWGVAEGYTEYDQLAVIGDLNLSNLLRRVDNHSPYRWALHTYAGVGLTGFHSYLIDSKRLANYPNDIEQPLDQGSVYWTLGAGLKYKISQLIDIELRPMYVLTGDDAFDGSGIQGGNVYIDPTLNPYMNLHESRSDNYFTVNLGLSFKIGKHDYHLAWFDPMQDLYNRVHNVELNRGEFIVCKNGDNDDDGVCDDWDRELDTPSGARVDGAGVALDADLDGVIDLNDECVTVPGTIENNGCPEKADKSEAIATVNKDFEGIEFALDSYKIRTKSFGKLNHSAEVIKSLGNEGNYLVIGATDTRGSASYNKTLSQHRAEAVVKYLVNKGVNASLLTAVGNGESDLKYPECEPASKCPEWKNEANRRVYFKEK